MLTHKSHSRPGKLRLSRSRS